MKKKILIILSIVIVLVIGGLILYKHETTLPEPKVSEGTRGELGIDANINEKNTQIKIAKYYECSKTAVRTSIYTIHKILFRIPEEQILIMKNRVNQCLKK